MKNELVDLEGLMGILQLEKELVLAGKLDLAAELNFEKSRVFENISAWTSLSADELNSLKTALTTNEVVLKNALIGVRRAAGIVTRHFSEGRRLIYYTDMGARCEISTPCERNLEKKI